MTQQGSRPISQQFVPSSVNGPGFSARTHSTSYSFSSSTRRHYLAPTLDRKACKYGRVTSFDRLSALDAAFLDIETERAPMQVGWTMRFAGQPPSIEELRQHVELRLTSVPRLRRCIVEPALGIGDPHWVDDPLFAIDRHVNVIQMIASSVQSELSAIAEELLSQPLDRSRPLWRLQLVTGLSDGCFAIIGQAHHALVDGLAAIEIATIIFDGVAAPDQQSVGSWLPADAPSTTEVLTAAALSRIGTGSDVAATLVRSLANGPGPIVEAVTETVAKRGKKGDPAVLDADEA